MDSATIIGNIEKVTAKWCKQRKAEERVASRRAYRRDVLTSPHITVKDVAWQVMGKAYLKASSNGTLPAHARQIMYAARGEVQELAGRKLNDQYFTQTLLPDYLNEHPDETSSWDVVFDARGHFEEPHTKKTVPLGTIQVREYLREIEGHVVSEPTIDVTGDSAFPTCGPAQRFGAILFIEKEGFMPLFKAVQLAARYDIAIMSTKGQSVTAARYLVDELCGGHDIPLLVLHDFDKSGFSIVGTLQRDTRRYEFTSDIEVTDLGLRLGDIEANNLESEDVHYGKTNPRLNLANNGATGEEIDFLCAGGDSWAGYAGRRVELNAFTSGDLVAWIESKLDEYGVKKLVPDAETLEAAYRRAVRAERLSKVVEEAREQAERDSKSIEVPEDLEQEIRDRLKDDPTFTWDDIVQELASDDLSESEE